MRAPHRKERITTLRLMAWLALSLVLSVAALAEQLSIKTYTTTDGLAHDQIQSIVQDSRGFLWFCTYDGLSRFDGYRFITYSVKDGLAFPRVNALLESRDGNYWIATSGGGVSRLNPTAQKGRGAGGAAQSLFTTYTMGAEEASNLVVVLYEDRAGNIWAGTQGGLFRLDAGDRDRGQFRLVELGVPSRPDSVMEVTALLEARDGSLWIGALSWLLRRLPDGRIFQYEFHPALATDYIRALLIDREDRLWLSHRAGLMILKPEPVSQLQTATGRERNLEWRPSDAVRNPNSMLPVAPGDACLYTVTDGVADGVVRALYQSGDGRIWIGSQGGLTEFDGHRFRAYTTAHGVSKGINAIAEDRDGNLWIGSQTSGAQKIVRNGLRSYRESDGLGHSEIISIFENQAGELCALGGKWTINRFDGEKFTAVRPMLPDHIVNSSSGRWLIIQDHTGEWWVATREGLYRFPSVNRLEDLARTPPLAVYTTRDGLADNYISRLFEDSGGDLWIGSFNPPEMLTRWERATGKFYRYAEGVGLPPFNWANVFGEDATGHLWIGLHNGGLARRRQGRFEVFGVADGAPAGLMQGLYRDRQGRLWIAASAGGAGRLDDPAAERPRFRAYTMFEGLSSNNLRCFAEDRWGRVYIGTARGVDRFDVATGQIKHYGTADGLIKSEVTAAFSDRHGALWFGAREGLSRLVPEPEGPGTPPPILISGLRIEGSPYPISELGETQVVMNDLAPNQNHLEIDFFGLSFGAGGTLRYQYKLEGADGEWKPPTEQRSVPFASLAPGRYRFLVRAVNTDGLVSESPASITFTILPPIWRRWWFFTLALFALAAAIYAFERYRVSRLIELERVRMRIATDLHDDIGAGLSRIAILSEVAHGRLGTGDLRGRDHMTTIAGASRELLDSMSDIVWAINPQKEHLKDLVQRMRRFASDLLTGRNIAFHFHAPESEQDLKLSADTRREVFLIFKESVNNLARHSGASEAEITLRVDRRWLTLEIKDNGRGFDAAPLNAGAGRSDGNGLMSMRERARRLGGELEIVSAPGQGATIGLRAPIQRHWWEEKQPIEDPRRRNRNQKQNGRSRLSSILSRLNKR